MKQILAIISFLVIFSTQAQADAVDAERYVRYKQANAAALKADAYKRAEYLRNRKDYNLEATTAGNGVDMEKLQPASGSKIEEDLPVESAKQKISPVEEKKGEKNQKSDKPSANTTTPAFKNSGVI